MSRLRRSVAGLAAAAALGAWATPAWSEVDLRWLGVAGFSFESDGVVLLHDPYLSRPSLLRTLFSRYEPDAELLTRLGREDGPAPELSRPRLLLVGHSHFDHLGDVPWLARAHGGTVVGSGTTVAISRGYGVPNAQVRRADPGDELAEGPFDIRVVESRHAEVLFGRVPLPSTLR